MTKENYSEEKLVKYLKLQGKVCHAIGHINGLVEAGSSGNINIPAAIKIAKTYYLEIPLKIRELLLDTNEELRDLEKKFLK